MENALLIAAIIGIAVVTVAVVILVAGILRELRNIGRASKDLSHFLNVVEGEITSTIPKTRAALDDLDVLLVKVTETVRRIDDVAEGIQRLVDGAYIASTVARTVRSSTAGLVSVYEGVKQGIKTLRGAQETDKEGSSDEQ